MQGEAALSGAWWALSDWCSAEGHGSEGRCCDQAARYVRGYFERDPRTINTKTWKTTGTILSGIAMSYELTAVYLGLPRKTWLIPDLIRDRPGVDWQCEPSCTAGYANAHE